MKTLKLTLVIAVGFLAGCAQLDRWLTDNSQKRVFKAEADWVNQGPEKLNMGFRKINRFAPIFFKHPKHGELVIQANAIDGVVAYQKDGGREIWRKKIQNGVESTAAIVNDLVFFGANDGFFYCISAANGETKWNFPTRIENLAEPLLIEDLVIFLSGSNTVYALDAVSGKQAWIYTRQDTQSLSIRGGSRPAYKNGNVYVGFSDGAVVSLAAKTGQLKWEKTLNKNKRFRDLDSNPVVDGDFLYIAGFDDHLYALRAATGDQVWKSEKGGYGTPLVTQDFIYFASSAGEFQALDRSTGQKVWAHPTKEGIATSAQIYKGLIVFGESQGNLKFLDVGTGKLVAEFDPGRGILSPPSVDEKAGKVFFISGEANVYSVKAAWVLSKRIPYLE